MSTILYEYKNRLDAEGINIKIIGSIYGYPFLEVDNILETLTQNDPVSSTEHLIVISPGGGSGKFGVVVTELAHKLKQGGTPNFVKFETFPVFRLPIDHPLNEAFIAATADLKNELVATGNGDTNYDKDIQNFAILKSLISHYPGLDSPIHNFIGPTDMGVNVIEAGIINETLVAIACIEEITRRIARYQSEFLNGRETSETIMRTIRCRQNLGRVIVKKI